jgi:hypothetical protein
MSFLADTDVITDDRPYTEFPLWRALRGDEHYRRILDAPRLRELLNRFQKVQKATSSFQKTSTATPTTASSSRPRPSRPARRALLLIGTSIGTRRMNTRARPRGIGKRRLLDILLKNPGNS